MAIFTTLRGEIHNSMQYKLRNSMEVDSVVIIAILSMLFITTRMVKTWTSVAKISRVLVENQVTTLSVVKIAIKFSPCRETECMYAQVHRLVSFEITIKSLARLSCLLVHFKSINRKEDNKTEVH